GRDGVMAELEQRGLSQHAREAMDGFLAFSRDAILGATARNSRKMLAQAQQYLERDSVADATDSRARDNLDQILELSERTAAAPHLVYDPFLARGLSYYTGAIMVVNVADLAGSLGGGGRYDNLVGMFSGQEIPACGFSLGLERILVVMSERGMFPPTLTSAPADVLVAMFSASAAADAIRVADQLRASGLRVFVYPDADKIGKQIKYADAQHIPYVAIVGDDEIKAGTVTVKDLAAQTQQTYKVSAAGAAIAEALRRRG
ncbi:MAG: ATP phosphoribosyltransferase regulatory subunit, partial [Vicinamibacterales bacterium]